MTVEFEVDGKPQGKGRPRLGKQHTYTPKRTVDYERKVKESYVDATNHTFGKSPVKAEILAVFAVPKSTRKSLIGRMISGLIKCIKRPDVDNIAKSILDALNGIAYYDDSQVYKLTVEKVYGTDDKVIVRLRDENG